MLNSNAELWIQALESGEFTQTTGFLENKHGNCCFGVACRVYEREVGGLRIDQQHNRISFNGTFGVLPTPVRLWLGLRTPKGEYGNEQALTMDNDHGKTFAEIVAIIRSEPPGLFEATNG